MNRFLKNVLLVIIILLSSACTKATQKSRVEEESLIYPLLIKDLCRSDSGYSPSLIIIETFYAPAFPYDDVEYLLWKLPSLRKETFDDFRVSVQAKRVLDSALLNDNEFCKFITPDKIDSALKEDPYWYNKNMLIYFSMVGFSRDFKQALVYREYYCGSECGGGDLYLLVRGNNIWMIESILDGWRS